jgi:hypothetical protein
MPPALYLAIELLRHCAATDLLLWEFMPDPGQVEDAAGEWMELYNPGPDSVKLAGWSVRSGSSARLPLDAAGSVAPGGYFVVARADSGRDGGFVPGQILSSGWSLPNASGSLGLYDPSGTRRDSVAWGGGWPLKPGRSVERNGTGCDGLDAACWGTSSSVYGLGDYGTPGGRNSRDTSRTATEGAIVGIAVGDDAVRARVWNRGRQDWHARELTWRAGREIRQNLSCPAGDTCAVVLPLAGIAIGDRMRVTLRLPSDAGPADDTAGVWLFGTAGRVLLSEVQASGVKGQPEWFELSQGVDVPIGLAGWSIGDTARACVFRPGTVLPAGGTLVLSQDCAALKAAWSLPSMPCADVPGWQRLSQVEDVLVLRDDRGNVRDSLGWSTAFWGSWPTGRSRERRSRAIATQSAANWVPSPDPLGATPGWAFGAVPGWSDPGTEDLSFSLDQRLFCPGDARVAPALGMRLTAPAGWKVRVAVFDLDRRRVRTLLDGAPPPGGKLAWDGRGDGDAPCRMGSYLVLVEGRSGTGRRTTRREWAVLGVRL